MTAHVSHNSGRVEWYTPSRIASKARSVLGDIDLDPASCWRANRSVRALRVFTRGMNGLSLPWKGRIYLNPPYTRGIIDSFIKKLISEYQQENTTEAILLLNNATETSWAQNLLSFSSAICLPRKRIRFLSPIGQRSSPLQGQMIVYVGNRPEIFTENFSDIGQTLLSN